MTKKLHIAIILPTIISKNGTAKQSLELAKILAIHGHHITFFTYAYLKKSTFPEFDNFHIYACVNVEKSLLYRFIKNVSSLENIYLYLSLVFIDRFRRLFIGENISIYNPHDWMGLWVVTGLEQPVPIIANINDVPLRANGFINKLKLTRDRKYTNKIDRIIVLDKINQAKVVKWLKINRNKVTVIRSGIDIEKYKAFNKKYDLKKKLGIPKKDVLLVCANILAPNRRYEDVLSLLTKYKKEGILLHLLILSKLDFNPTYAAYLKRIIARDTLGRQVHFFDQFFTDEERMTYIKNSDILIFPNNPQTWGLTVLEAMALGVPVIVSSGSEVSEVLHNGKDAYIFEKQNVTDLSEKIAVYLRSKEIYARIAKRGKQYVMKSFTWEKFGTEIEEIMLESINNNH